MGTPQTDRDKGGTAFSREQLEQELAAVKAREEHSYSPAFEAGLDKQHARERETEQQARRLGNE
jgi:hypothetical protein